MLAKKVEMSLISPQDAQAIENYAKLIREQVGAVNAPIDPFAIATRYEIDAFLSDFPAPHTGTEGMIQFADGRYKIWVTTQRTPAEQRFICAHELGHFFLHMVNNGGGPGTFTDNDYSLNHIGDGPLPTLSRDQILLEQQANQFAISLMMPETLVRLHASSGLPTSILAQHFNVPIQYMEARQRSVMPSFHQQYPNAVAQ